MAINLDLLFQQLGRVGKCALVVNQGQAALDPALTDLSDEFQNTDFRDLVSTLDISQDALVRSQSGFFATLQSLAQSVLLRTVADDSPASGRTTRDAVAEVLRQMIVQGETVEASVIGVSSSALTGFEGTGVLVASTKRGDGLVQEHTIAEVGRLSCQGDSYAGTATVNQEPFLFVGKPNRAGVWDYDYPQGSGASTPIQTVDPSDSLLTNGDFETWTGSPLEATGWTLEVGTWGTDIEQDATALFGTYSAEWNAGTTNTSIYQTFVAGDLVAQTSYAVNLWLRTVTGTAGAGVMTVELIEDPAGSPAVINDEQGVANSFTIDLTALTTSWVARNGVFRLPKVLPDEIALRIRISTDLSGADVLMDGVAMAGLTALYTGGPGAVIFAGGTPFVTGDSWDVTMTNDRGGASYLATFQAFFDRMCGTRRLGVMLPSAGSPTLADTLITS